MDRIYIFPYIYGSKIANESVKCCVLGTLGMGLTLGTGEGRWKMENLGILTDMSRSWAGSYSFGLTFLMDLSIEHRPGYCSIRLVSLMQRISPLVNSLAYLEIIYK